MDKILITGSNGFVASRIIQAYRSVYDIVAINKEILDITKESETVKVIKEIIEDVNERFKVKPRDLRISNSKIDKYGIRFSDTETAIRRCLKEFKLH